MSTYRPVVIEDSRFPDGKGLLLAWECELSNGREWSRYLFSSARRFFVHRHEAEAPRQHQFLELTLDQATNLSDRMTVQMLPLPGHLIELEELPEDEEVPELISW